MSSEPFVKTWERRDVVESTSDLARELVVTSDVTCPLVVTARRQTRGRGRGRNSWWSDEGSLTFTIALDPGAHGLRPDHEPKLALAAAVALIDALAPWLADTPAGVRWPNDVEVRKRKLAGILPERVETPRGVRLLVGIGLNGLSRLDDAPPEVSRMAVSLADLAAGPLSVEDLDAAFAAILDRFASILGPLSDDAPGLAARWGALDALRDQMVRVDLGPRILRGRAGGIAASGALRLEDEHGVREIFGGRVLRDE